MEASADPFAEEAQGADPFAEQESSSIGGEEPPVVDREGERVEQQASQAGQRMAEEAAAKAAEPTAEPEAASGGEESAQEAPAAPASADTSSEAGAAASAPQSGQGRAQQRLYKLLYQTDAKQWTEAPLDQWKDSEYVVKDGSEFWIAASNADQVRRVGYVLFQRPADGVTLMPVAKGAWKPVRVKAKQVPTRERLEFESA